MFSIFAPFWSLAIGSLPLRIPTAHWLEKVLPGLGLDSLRLIEITLPSGGGPLPHAVVSYFDQARSDYDGGRYREAIQKCRDVRHAIEEHLGAIKERPVADVVAERVKLPPGAPQRPFLDGIWRALADLTSAAHHKEASKHLTQADASACLLLTALVVEYIETLLRPAS
jgi:hypothetical protein